ncbi:MAG: cellulase family glycosylhydrolase [Acidimicrobiales bacterium]
MSGASTIAPTDVAVVAPDGPVAHAGRWITDGTGRVLVIHGVNMPSKSLPAYPAALGFGDADAALLASSGLNAVRLTVERYAVEPSAGRFDDIYLAQIKSTVELLARHGILSMIDFHQDEYGPVFFDNGFPGWMTVTDGLPNLYQVGFPAQYLANPALNRAFDHFWANDIGPSGRPLQADDADILAHVALNLAHEPGLLGYEIMNEPWPGSTYPSCLLPAVGCPLFDRTLYSAYYSRVIPAIRAADAVHMIWYEPLSTFNQGVPTSVVPPRDPRLGFAFHDYPLCTAVTGAGAALRPAEAGCAAPDAAENSTVLSNALAHSATSGSALLETEFGATMNTSTITRQLSQYDQATVPWMFWSYTRYIDALSSNGTLEPPTGTNVNQAMLGALARPYPQLVAGTPIAWNFEPATKAFSLRYSTNRADGRGAFPAGSETDVAVPALQYPNGYRVSVSGGRAVSTPNAPVLRVLAAGPGPVSVAVAP